MARENPNNLNNHFLHKNLKTLTISLFGFVVLVYFIYTKDTENIKWIVSLVLSFLAGKGLK